MAATGAPGSDVASPPIPRVTSESERGLRRCVTDKHSRLRVSQATTVFLVSLVSLLRFPEIPDQQDGVAPHPAVGLPPLDAAGCLGQGPETELSLRRRWRGWRAGVLLVQPPAWRRRDECGPPCSRGRSHPAVAARSLSAAPGSGGGASAPGAPPSPPWAPRFAPPLRPASPLPCGRSSPHSDCPWGRLRVMPASPAPCCPLPCPCVPLPCPHVPLMRGKWCQHFPWPCQLLFHWYSAAALMSLKTQTRAPLPELPLLLLCKKLQKAVSMQVELPHPAPSHLLANPEVTLSPSSPGLRPSALSCSSASLPGLPSLSPQPAQCQGAPGLSLGLSCSCLHSLPR